MKRDRIREVSMEVTVGAFMFMILLALGVFTIILSRESLFKPTYYSELQFDEIMGLREGDNVYVRGVSIGKIRKIHVEPERVMVRVALDQPLHLREDYRVEILPTSVLGGRYLYVYQGSPTAPPLAPDAEIRGTTPVDLIDQATRTVQLVRKALDQDGILRNLSQGMEKLNAIVSRAERGEGTLGKLINDDSVYNDLKAVGDNLKTVTDRIAKGEGTLGKFLADDGSMYREVEQVVKNLESATRNLSEGKGLLGKMLSDDDTIYDDLRASAQSIREITDTMNRGEGTLGKLLRDDTLFEDAKLLVGELRATADDFRETAPITTFTSIFFGAF